MHQLPTIFNCSNDMALAANVRQYFPPRRIQQMEADAAALSRYWESGPWGWSLATKAAYQRMGISSDLLPSDEWLSNLRQLSSRQFASRYLHELLSVSRAEGWGASFLGDEMQYCTSVSELLPCDYPRIFKSPWSSSGRGIVVAEAGPLSADATKRLQGFVRTQGGFVADRFHTDKRVDFAMEFWVHADHVEFLGYSVFQTAQHGAYGGNYVESQEHLLQRIGLPADILNRLVAYHSEHLLGHGYEGPVGIDMLATSTRVHPVIEMNFRMNMGILALNLYNKGMVEDQFLTPQREHCFCACIQDGLLCIKPPSLL